MGVDFLRTRAKAFTKAWDRSKLELSRRSLFSRDPEELRRGVIARIDTQRKFDVGDAVLIRSSGARLDIVADMAVHGEILKPPECIASFVRESGGYANGTVAESFPDVNLIQVSIQ